MNNEILRKIKKYLEMPTGYYITDNNMIGDAYGPMSAGRYCSIESFYKAHKEDIDNADALVQKFRDEEAYYNETFTPVNKKELQKYIKEKQERYSPGVSLTNIDTRLITDMSYLFDGLTTVGDISNWDVSHVTDMSYMFAKMSFSSDMSKWDVSNVTNMQGMFKMSCYTGNIGTWNVMKVTNMAYMFENAAFMNDISQWRICSVSNMTAMFKHATILGSISFWEIPDDATQDEMFEETNFIGAFGRYEYSPKPKTRKELDNILSYRLRMHYIMNGTEPKDCYLSDIDTSMITDMSYLFACKKNLHINISFWDVSNVTNFTEMFSNSDFNGNISKWEINENAVTDRMFENCPIKNEYKPKI